MRLLAGGRSYRCVEIGRYPGAQGIARQKIPEALLVLECLPRTVTGKVLKDRLRETALNSPATMETVQRSSPVGKQAS